MKATTPITFAEILSKGGLKRGINLTDQEFNDMLEAFASHVESVSVTESNSKCEGLHKHFTEFEITTLDQLATDLYYETIKTDDRKYLTNRIATELAKPILALKEKIDEGIDMIDTPTPF